MALPSRRTSGPAPATADPARRAEAWALKEQVPIGLVAAFLIAAVVAWSLSWSVPPSHALLWLLAVAGVGAARAFELRRAKADDPDLFPVSTVRRHLAWTAVAGLLWALPPWILWPGPALEPMFVVTLAILGLTSGASVAYAPMRGHFVAFAGPPVLSLGLRLVAEGEPYALTTAAFCPIYLGAMVWLAHKRRLDAEALAANHILLESLQDAALQPDETPQRSLRQLLVAGCEYFGLELGIVSRVRGDEYRILAIHSRTGEATHAPGQVLSLADTVCSHTMTRDGPVAYARGEPDGRKHPAHRDDCAAYIGHVIRVDGEPFGTVNFSDARRTRFRTDRYKEDLVALMAEWLGGELTRRRMEAAIARHRQRVETLTDSIPALVSYITPDHRYAYVNSQYERLFGRSRESFEGATVASVAGEASYRRLRPFLERALAGEEQRFEFSPELPDDRSPTFRVHFVPDWSAENHVRGCFALLTEVTRYKETETRLLEEARRDFLTGLLNRRGFLTAVAEVVEDHRRRPAEDFVCYLDLDRFKEINDRAGHEAGDEALREVAKLMRDTVRSSDVLARIGGDEFGLLLAGCSRRAAIRLLERIRRRVTEAPFDWDGRRFHLGVSIGGVAVDRGHLQVRDLLRQADAACYAAKREPGGGVVILPGG